MTESTSPVCYKLRPGCGAEDDELTPSSDVERYTESGGSPNSSLVSESSSSNLELAQSSSSISDLLGSPAISPLVKHYDRYSQDDLGLYVSIAQGGLQRIRREAQEAKITLRDIVDLFSSSISNMACNNDAVASCRNAPDTALFIASSQRTLSLNDFLWRIVRSLNAHSDPCLFASDGSDLAVLSEAQTDETASCSTVSEGENSAMGRGLRCLLLAFVYIDRACTRNPETFFVTSLSAHRILLTAIYAATKFTDDMLPRAHRTFAKLGGVTSRELKLLEVKFCKLVDFRFYVTEAEFQALCMEQLRCAIRCMRRSREADLN